MPSKKKKYNARFPPARIKKIMQTDEEIGKVAAAVPVIISRALELFLESLLTKACHVTQSKNAKTMTTSHLKQCIELEQQFDFLKDLVATVPDMQGEGDENHGEPAGDKVPPRRGRKLGSAHKNGGAGSKAKDKKLSGTESELEEDSEDSETDGDGEDGSQSSTNLQAATRFHSLKCLDGVLLFYYRGGCTLICCFDGRDGERKQGRAKRARGPTDRPTDPARGLCEETRSGSRRGLSFQGKLLFLLPVASKKLQIKTGQIKVK
nr:dr1-associated corepressor isoform X1 [Syngnathus scovelli]